MNALIGKHSPYGNSYGNQDAYKVVRRSTHTFATCAAAAGNRRYPGVPARGAQRRNPARRLVADLLD
jgi:hypothetical protein